jgi:hypothetical protein
MDSLPFTMLATMATPPSSLSSWRAEHTSLSRTRRGDHLSPSLPPSRLTPPFPRLASLPRTGRRRLTWPKRRANPSAPPSSSPSRRASCSLLVPPLTWPGVPALTLAGHQKESKLAAEDNIVAALARAREGDGPQPGPLPPPPPAPAVAAPAPAAAPNQQGSGPDGSRDPVVGPRPHGPREEETKSTETQTDLDINSESDRGGDASSQLPLLLQLLSEMVTLPPLSSDRGLTSLL